MFRRKRVARMFSRYAAGFGMPAAIAMIAAYWPKPSANQIVSSTGAISHWNGSTQVRRPASAPTNG